MCVPQIDQLPPSTPSSMIHNICKPRGGWGNKIDPGHCWFTWLKMNPQQQENLCFLAFSLTNLYINEMHELTDFYTSPRQLIDAQVIKIDVKSFWWHLWCNSIRYKASHNGKISCWQFRWPVISKKWNNQYCLCRPNATNNGDINRDNLRIMWGKEIDISIDIYK